MANAEYSRTKCNEVRQGHMYDCMHIRKCISVHTSIIHALWCSPVVSRSRADAAAKAVGDGEVVQDETGRYG